MAQSKLQRLEAMRQIYEDRYVAANDLGAETFGTLWLAATEEAVRYFRDMGLGDQIERDYQLRAALSRALYRVLCRATQHPNNLARAKSLIELRRTANKQE